MSGTAFKRAESFADRDMVCRIYAAECYDLAVKLADAGKHKVSLQHEVGCAAVACLSWSFFFLSLDNLERVVAGIVAGLTMVLVFRIYKRSTRESSDSLQKDEGETSETSLPTDSSSS